MLQEAASKMKEQHLCAPLTGGGFLRSTSSIYKWMCWCGCGVLTRVSMYGVDTALEIMDFRNSEKW